MARVTNGLDWEQLGSSPHHIGLLSKVDHAGRTATPRHLLMCRPKFFAVSYSINPWMDPARSTDAARAHRQWAALRDLYRELGHRIEEVAPLPGLPDMVFAANGATVVGGRVLGARFRYSQRCDEAPAYLRWFADHGFRDIFVPEWINEGEGDFLFTGSRILAGSGFRSDPRAHAEAERCFGLSVVGLTLVDPRFYHLDTALAVLDRDEIMYFPQAFSPESREVLRDLYPDALLAEENDALGFGMNAFSDGRHVVLNASAQRIADRLRERGFHPIGVDVSELIKAGGGVKCCTLELRGAAEG